jgi:hypothetical protein
VIPELMRLTGDKGARELLATAARIEAAREIVRDFDRPEDFA